MIQIDEKNKLIRDTETNTEVIYGLNQDGRPNMCIASPGLADLLFNYQRI